MTNEEIMQKWYNNELLSDELLNLARADERAKMQGVDVWISWDGRDGGTVDAWHKEEPRRGENDMFYGSSDINGKHSHITELHKDSAKLLGISPGECAKFKIVRCE